MIGSQFVAQAGLKLLYCLYFLGAGVTGISHHTQLESLLASFLEMVKQWVSKTWMSYLASIPPKFWCPTLLVEHYHKD